jgi:hypothetical protein
LRRCTAKELLVRRISGIPYFRSIGGSIITVASIQIDLEVLLSNVVFRAMIKLGEVSGSSKDDKRHQTGKSIKDRLQGDKSSQSLCTIALDLKYCEHGEGDFTRRVVGSVVVCTSDSCAIIIVRIRLKLVGYLGPPPSQSVPSAPSSELLTQLPASFRFIKENSIHTEKVVLGASRDQCS